jgi:predicted RNA binding protein YcfA (HicA-like mRNA interferase family)
MPHGLRNWAFNDVVNFLKERGFSYSHTRGSHHFYFRPDNPKFPAVCVPFHGRRAIKPWDMRNIVRQSGIPLKAWLEN